MRKTMKKLMKKSSMMSFEVLVGTILVLVMFFFLTF